MLVEEIRSHQSRENSLDNKDVGRCSSCLRSTRRFCPDCLKIKNEKVRVCKSLSCIHLHELTVCGKYHSKGREVNAV